MYGYVQGEAGYGLGGYQVVQLVVQFGWEVRVDPRGFRSWSRCRSGEE